MMESRIYYVNGKYVVHFLSLLTDKEMDECEQEAQRLGDTFSTNTKYNFAIRKAKPFDGKKFHNKQYGGGIAFDYREDAERMLKSVEESGIAALKG